MSTIRQSDRTSADLEAKWAAGKAAPLTVGSSAAIWLHRPVVQVQFDVKNTGKVTGGEVSLEELRLDKKTLMSSRLQIPQLYIQHPISAGEPPSLLKGFSDVLLRPGQTKKVTLLLSRYDLSVWDTIGQGWVRPKGIIKFAVGQSSRLFKLFGTIPM